MLKKKYQNKNEKENLLLSSLCFAAILLNAGSQSTSSRIMKNYVENILKYSNNKIRYAKSRKRGSCLQLGKILVCSFLLSHCTLNPSHRYSKCTSWNSIGKVHMKRENEKTKCRNLLLIVYCQGRTQNWAKPRAGPCVWTLSYWFTWILSFLKQF